MWNIEYFGFVAYRHPETKIQRIITPKFVTDVDEWIGHEPEFFAKVRENVGQIPTELVNNVKRAINRAAETKTSVLPFEYECGLCLCYGGDIRVFRTGYAMNASQLVSDPATEFTSLEGYGVMTIRRRFGGLCDALKLFVENAGGLHLLVPTTLVNTDGEPVPVNSPSNASVVPMGNQAKHVAKYITKYVKPNS
jgi:hypothetical protein